MGEIIFDGEIPCGDEIRLDGGWVDLISSAKQISSEQSEDFIALCAISLKNEQSCCIIRLDKLEFDEGANPQTFALVNARCKDSLRDIFSLLCYTPGRR